ncbi:MAG: farnesyl-diphosphate farnesyltransferase [Candidatus Rokubacteria bacterium GWC2_70_16]|nr:MAG: farnesyl-diphosphate farnesyltransferase [Candidatus Rokubacteria bacterium GWC2_70_16]
MAGGDLTSALLKRVSRSFYLSVAVLPPGVRPTIGLAYLLARAADTIADSRLIARRARITHLRALRAELDSPVPGRLEEIVAATREARALGAERTLLERLPDCLAAHRALAPADRERVRAVLATVIEGMTQDLERFPGEDERGLAALETRQDLDRYTYLVAGCVGEFWTEVHVAHRPRLRGWDLAKMKALGVRFGKALQLTNVLRDLPRDLRQGRCYLPSRDLGFLGLEPRDLLDPASGLALRPLLVELLNVALDHYEAGWQYTFAIPRAETRMRLGCAWPLLIGLRTLDLLAREPNWLDPAVRLKVPRVRVYGMIAQSLTTVWSTRALGRQARRLRERIRVERPGSTRP